MQYPGSARTHYTLANAWKASGSLSEAEESYRAALAQEPNFLEARYNLATTLKDQGQLGEAFTEFEYYHRMRRIPPASAAATEIQRPVQSNADLRRNLSNTSVEKPEHDIEQFRYLREANLLESSFDEVIDAFESVCSEVRSGASDAHVVPLSTKHLAMIGDSYNRAVYVADAPALAASPINPALDPAQIEADYSANAPGVVCIDHLLTQEALDEVRQFCLESTIWYDFEHTGGYLGAYLNDGFCCPLLLQIADNLRAGLPTIFGAHRLRQMWAYKYDNRRRGIATHADFAAVNVNFWITPDSAKTDPDSTGLTVYTSEAPLDWDFRSFNYDRQRINAFLAETNSGTVRYSVSAKRTVPLSWNRSELNTTARFFATATRTAASTSRCCSGSAAADALSSPRQPQRV